MSDAGLEAVERINVWLWQYPHNRSNMGDICFTATPLACLRMKSILRWVVQGGARRIALDLPLLTERDADCIALERPYITFGRLNVQSDGDADDLLQIEADYASKTVSILVSLASVSTLDHVLSEVAVQNGDWYVPVKFGKGLGTLWYWPCMGHTHKVCEPESPFPE